MDAMTKTQRRRAHRKPVDLSVIRIEVTDGIGRSNWVTADVVDIIDDGFGVNLMTPLLSGSTVVVRGKPAEDRIADHRKAGVRWCVGKPDGTFRAGLEFLDSCSTFPLDCYEVMQLSPNADLYTISRVYRMLASRYHPDNTETGNNEKFLRLSEAHQILSDPEKRAKFDAHYRDAGRLRGAIFDQASASNGSELERRKRFERGNVSDRSRRHGDHFPPSVGALRGWSAALRRPGA
jgi:DnaJ domain/PilZ domain